MELIKEKVVHKSFGAGIIKSVENNKIIVDFEKVGDKTFQYPNVFESYLTLNDEKLQLKYGKIAKELIAKDNEKKEAFNKIKRDTAAKFKSDKVSKELGRRSVAFKCTFCDGGRCKNRIGFNGICSPENIRKNVKEGRVWCNQSYCRLFCENQISYKELIDLYEDGSCYESYMLRDWTALAGIRQNGENDGKPFKLEQAKLNSLAVLTTRLPDTQEKDRIIFALFLIDDMDEGNDCDEGKVSCHSEYHLELTPNESEKMRFWKYYANSNSKENARWGTGLFRYIDNEISAVILKDAVSIISDKKRKVDAEAFFNHFCEINRINKDDIPAPSGALSIK